MPSLLFLDLHWFAAALQLTLAGLGDDELGAALGAGVSLANLVRH